MSFHNSVTQIISASRNNPALLAELEKFRREVTVMFTDIKGSTSYFERHGDVAGLMMVSECNDLLRKCVEARQGRVIKTIGDAVMATFDDPKEAVRAAVEMQNGLVRFNAPKPPADWVAIRIGLNHGAGIVKSNDVFGDVVNVASRVESVAQPEQIVISDTVHRTVAAVSDLKIVYLGRFALKGKEEDRDLYEVIWRGTAAPPAHTIVHTVISRDKAIRLPGFRVQHLKHDGSMGAEKQVTTGALTIGASEGDWQFQGDPKLAPLHARFSIEGDQVRVEDLSGGRGVFVRLASVYTLQDADQIVMGSQVLTFREKPMAMAAAAATGTQLVDLTAMLEEPVAELVGSGDRMHTQHFPLVDEAVTWGRTKGTYIFPDDHFMSGAHCRIYQRGENFFLEDIGSRNGTFVRVRDKAPVPLGTTVRVGGQIFRVQP